jgi:streptogrisin C
MARRSVFVAAASVLALGALVGPAALGDARADATAIVAGAAPIPPAMAVALQRDLGLTPEQAVDRLARELAAGELERRARAELGTHYGGAWLAGPDQQLVVAVTDVGDVARVRALGAQPRVVARSADALATVKATLDAAARPDPSVSSWYVDEAANTVVVRAAPAAKPVALAFVEASGADATAVRFEESTERITDLADVRGGDIYYNSNLEECSIGFSVTSIPTPTAGGYVTAGHCGAVGTETRDGSFGPLGTVRGARYPGRDQGWVQVDPGWTLRPFVNTYGSGNLNVVGWREAGVGASVCRSGQRTRWRCGTIQARNVTTNTPGGVVIGLTRTSACAEPGDSGGPYLAGQQAQGVASRGSGTCASGGLSYFQPVVTALAEFKLRLVTAGTGRTAPIIISVQCERTGGFFCDLSQYHPDPVQIRWTLNGHAVPSWNNKTHVSGGCTGSQTTMPVTVTVSNSSGSDGGSASVHCSRGPR